MDRTETYIKMSDCPEVQGQWKPKVGDCFSFVGDIHILSDYEICALEKKELSDIDCWNKVVTLMGGHFVDHWNECREGFVWLPYQDQIQEMMPPYDHPSTMIMYFSLFANNEEMFEGLYGSHRFKLTIKSMEQLWLAFYMLEKHKKVWDGEKWAKEK